MTGTPLSHRYSQFAVQFIKNTTASNTPFLVYLAFSHMHVPIVYNPSYHGKSGEKGLLGDALMELDDSVGILIDALEAENVRNNTIIFLTGDNGPPEDQCDWGGSKGPFMGAWQKTGQKGGSAGKMYGPATQNCYRYLARTSESSAVSGFSLLSSLLSILSVCVENVRLAFHALTL